MQEDGSLQQQEEDSSLTLEAGAGPQSQTSAAAKEAEIGEGAVIAEGAGDPPLLPVLRAQPDPVLLSLLYVRSTKQTLTKICIETISILKN